MMDVLEVITSLVSCIQQHTHQHTRYIKMHFYLNMQFVLLFTLVFKLVNSYLTTTFLSRQHLDQVYYPACMVNEVGWLHESDSYMTIQLAKIQCRVKTTCLCCSSCVGVFLGDTLH